ncbi:DUF4434 domain-containing protein [Nonomuraea sp. SBT364]|uniref:DUF4434 domain-containing protein n=1 Tax=Nonomuraea sp. SBT364 TaxID=1580530 RepID=UPI00066AAFD6|nr:DUF4434 domain-containing protein [Nonomuraea sp. SBT364]
MLQRVLRIAVALTVVILAVLPDSEVSVVDDGCPPRDTRVTAPYPITGYWVIPRPDRCVTQRTVEAVHAVGGDTLITFGARILPAQPDAHGRVAAAAGCVEDGRTCYEAARATGKPIRRIYTYVTSERFGDAVLRCPGLDRRVESGRRTYYRLMLAPSCDAAAFDLLLIATDGDGVGDLLAEAAAYGMAVIPGLPVPPKHPAKPWLPDLAHLPALNELTARIMADYRRRYGASPALGGVYQSFELAMRDRADDDPIIALYAAQHAVVAAGLPGEKIMVSPFWDARRGRGFEPDQVAKGFADIAATRAGAPMAIAIQDGRGVGKVPVHGADQAAAPVDERLEPVVGRVANATAYYGSTRDYVAAAARRVTPGVELWVNVEVFEPTQAAGECGRANPFPLRGRTTKSRVDAQVAAVGRDAGKIIAYGWDPFLTCRHDHTTPSLADDLTAGWREPIIAHAYRAAFGGRDGVVVEGYHLGGGTLTFTYRQAGGAAARVSVPQGWHDPRTGADPRLPDGLQSAWAPFTPDDPDPGHPWITITATNATGHTTTTPYAWHPTP